MTPGAKGARAHFPFAALAALALTVGPCPTARADEGLPFAPAPHHHPPPRVSSRAEGRWYPGFAMRVLAVAGTTEQTAVGSLRQHDGAIALEERALAYMNQGDVSARYTDRIAIGYGSGGFEGGAATDPAVGLAPNLGGSVRPYLRLGLRAEWMHYERFHVSLFELPQAQLGVALFDGPVHVDAGVRGGFVWIGRFGVDTTATEALGDAGDVAARLALGLEPIRLEAEVSRLSPRGARPPVDQIDSLLCGAPRPLAACFHAVFYRAALLVGTSAEPTWASSVGVSIGIGPAEWR